MDTMDDDVLRGLYEGQGLALDRSLAECCPSADTCWGTLRRPTGQSRRDPGLANGSIFKPWVGPDYRPGGVCVVGLNLRIGPDDSQGTDWTSEEEIAAGQRRSLLEGRKRKWGSLWAYATMRGVVSVLRSAGGLDAAADSSWTELAEGLDRSARVQAVKCSPPDADRGAPTPTMRQACPTFLLENELAVLRPGVVLTYGQPAMHAVRRLGTNLEIERQPPRFRRISMTLGDRPVTLFALTHPAHSGWPKDQWLLETSLATRPLVGSTDRS